MTNDLISREALLEELREELDWAKENDPEMRSAFQIALRRVKKSPAVDAVPVVHAHYGFTGPHIGETWSPYAEHGTCSNCKSRILIDPQHKNFCPNCGARINKEADSDVRRDD